jgi:fructose-1,6-bisphosphatase I
MNNHTYAILQKAFINISSLLQEKDQIQLGKDLNGTNASNDVQKPIDIQSNEIMINAAKEMPDVIGYISEEEREIVIFDNLPNEYISQGLILVFDPLDGSKNVLSNLTAGTIYGFYEYDLFSKKIVGIFESGYALYGPATIMVSTDRNNVTLYQLNKKEKKFKFVDVLSPLKTKKEKIISINAMNPVSETIRDVLTIYSNNGYTHRWAGAMVADCHQIIMRGGVFIYPENEKAENGKIRLLYEAAPLAYIFHLLGGMAIDTKNKLILEKVRDLSITNDDVDIHRAIPVIMTSQEEYLKLTSLLFNK